MTKTLLFIKKYPLMSQKKPTKALVAWCVTLLAVITLVKKCSTWITTYGIET